jgi:hypothetical protein
VGASVSKLSDDSEGFLVEDQEKSWCVDTTPETTLVKVVAGNDVRTAISERMSPAKPATVALGCTAPLPSSS